jgi:hypothetical protein
MVLLSGKRKCKDNVQQKILNQFIQPYLDNKHTEVKENMLCMHTQGLSPFYKKIMNVIDTIPIQVDENCNLSYQFKTIIKLNPEYEIYNLIYGKTRDYDTTKIVRIKDLLSKKYSFSKIKYILTV